MRREKASASSYPNDTFERALSRLKPVVCPVKLPKIGEQIAWSCAQKKIASDTEVRKRRGFKCSFKVFRKFPSNDRTVGIFIARVYESIKRD